MKKVVIRTYYNKNTRYLRRMCMKASSHLVLIVRIKSKYLIFSSIYLERPNPMILNISEVETLQFTFTKIKTNNEKSMARK